MTREWRPLRGKYEVSNDGLVRNPNRKKPFLASHLSKGYLLVSLWLDGKSQRLSIHRLVLEAFVSPCPPGLQGRHLDGDQRNNRLENLAWGTAQQNADDREEHGRTARGGAFPQTKLSEDDVVAIRSSNETLAVLAERYGVDQSNISCVRLRKTWKHI